MTVLEKIVLDPKTQAFVDGLAAQKGKPIYELSYKDARKVLEDAQANPVKTTLKTKFCRLALPARCLCASSVRKATRAPYLR
jgi:hypothetical protein